MSSAETRRLRIGQVCDLLRDEFSDISISKLRFLQDKGIVAPERTPGGYRSYSEEDVEKLRAALRLQRDQFLPLRIIRDELQRRLEDGPPTVARPMTANEIGESELAVGSGTLVAGRVQLDAPPQLVTAEALVRAAAVDHAFLDACRAADIVAGLVQEDGTLRYSVDEVGLVRCARELVALGLDLRHVRQASLASARQGALVEQRIAGALHGRGDAARAQAIDTAARLAEQLAQLMRIAFVRDVSLTVAASHADGSTGGGPAPSHRIAAPLL